MGESADVRTDDLKDGKNNRASHMTTLQIHRKGLPVLNIVIKITPESRHLKAEIKS